MLLAVLMMSAIYSFEQNKDTRNGGDALHWKAMGGHVCALVSVYP